MTTKVQVMFFYSMYGHVYRMAEAIAAGANILGISTRFGNMSAQLRNFLDQTGGFWMKGALVGKVGSAIPLPRPSMAVKNPPL